MGEPRRVHSGLDRLPKDLVTAMLRMVIQCEWPDDCDRTWQGKPRYADVSAYAKQKGYNVSEAAVGRYARRHRWLTKHEDAAERTRQAILRSDDGTVSETQKAAAELLTAHILDALSGPSDLGVGDLKDLASANKLCASIVMASDKYIRERMAEKVQKAKQAVAKMQPRGDMDPETLRHIREQVYGIFDDHLGWRPASEGNNDKPDESPEKGSVNGD